MSVTTIFPAWKQAVNSAVKEFTWGDVIPSGWLCDNFDLPLPPTGSVEEFRRYGLLFLRSMDSFREALLTKHNMALKSVTGVGYEVVHPAKQTQYASEKLVYGVRKAFRDAGMLSTHLDYSVLTQKERQDALEFRGKLAAFQAISGRAIGKL